jgi:hypothetical protein
MSLPFKTNIEIHDIPTEQNHAARLRDVYDIVGSHMKSPVLAASTGNLNATYAVGPLTLTATANGPLSLDDIDVAVGDRVLVANQTDGTQNGIYEVTTAGDGSTAWVLTRAEDFNSTSEISTGVKVHVTKGTSFGDVTFVLTTDNPVLDSTSLIFVVDTGKILNIKELRFNITGDDVADEFTFTHGWGTFNVTVDVIEDSAAKNYPEIFTSVLRPTNNTVKVTFGVAPVTGENYIVIVRAEV